MKGTVTKRGKQSWRLKFDIERDPVTGARRFHTCTVRGTKKKAEAELTTLMNEANKGTLVNPSKLTVSDYLTQWLDRKADRLSPLTRQRYGETIDRMIAPTLGRVELQKLRPVDVQQWLIAIREGKRGKRAPRTIVHAFRILQAALAAAVKLDLIPRNVADNAEPPSGRVGKVTIFKAEEIAVMLSALAGTRVYPIACLALYTGMRRSELLALQWGDLNGNMLKVQRSLEQTRAGIRFKPPKTEAGVRVIVLPPRAVELLGAHRKAVLELRLQLGQGKLGDTNLIFANADDSPISPNYFSIMWGRELKRAGLPSRTFHSIRQVTLQRSYGQDSTWCVSVASLGTASPR
jgi:integrase